ncbi:MAG: RNA polymerase factor sigma-54 [Rhodothermales bacterium]
MLNLQQKQQLQQKLSPQQIQYIKLLQLPTLALEQRIKAEMEINPLLEEGLEEEDETVDDQEEIVDDRTDADELREDEREQEGDQEEEFDWDELINNTDDLYGYKARVDYSDEDDRESPMPARESMVEHLRDQLSFLDLSDDEEMIAEQIIGSIDEDGYLRRPLESIVDDIMFNQGITLDESDVEAVLGRIQQLDPVGIGSRDLRECLLVQLYSLPEDATGRDVAIDMLEDCYKDFTMKHFSSIKKKLECPDEELKEAYDLIQHRLNPKPGEGDFTAQQNYITPDFTVQYVDDEFIITLNGRNAPELRISKQYRHMLHKIAAQKKKKNTVKKEVDDDTKKFLKNKFESARWFINSINQRRHTMTKVMHAIVDLQEDFFKYGEGHLKPMILKDIAEIIDMDISTVSRVVNGKYVQTEFGVYELKYFFSEGLETDSGEEISNKEVKAIIEGIVEEEDKTKPLSDQKIADRLEERGFKIARRTVTKYREQLGVPVARLRKEIVLEE